MVRVLARLLFVAIPLAFTSAPAAAQRSFADADAINAFVRQELELDTQRAALVIGLIDADGSRVLSYGTLDNGADRPVDGDSLFFIGSVTKTFTDLLLLDMVARGEMQLDDPVVKYLPASVTMPTHNGKQITLLDLAAHTSGLPGNPDNMSGVDVREQYESYTVEKMYDYLSRYELPRDPGAKWEYSNVAMALLGHVIALKSGESFESLVINRICQPLHMDNTCVVPTSAMAPRLALGHDDAGNFSRPFQLQVYQPAGSVHSTANDLLKYAAVQAGITQSPLSPLINQSHEFRQSDPLFGRTALPWVDRCAIQPPGMQLLAHAGGAGSYHAWVGFDALGRRGVVVLTTANNTISVESVGWTILQRMPLTPERKLDMFREYVGIGTAIELDGQTHVLHITKVLPGSPAEQAGLSAGLFIVKIDDAPTAGKSLDECLNLIRGPIGTKIRLELADAQGDSPTTVELTRNKFNS